MRDYHKSPVENFTEIGPVGGALILADKQADKRKDERDEAK
jgi:hypothetical protein